MMKRSKAMTLVEIMMALTVFFAGAGIMYEAFFKQRKTLDHVSNQAFIQDAVYRVFSQLEKDLQSCERVVEFSNRHISLMSADGSAAGVNIIWTYKPEDRSLTRRTDQHEYDFGIRGAVAGFELFIKSYKPLTVDTAISLASRNTGNYGFFRRFSSLVMK